MEIKVSKLRGVESYGMICASSEIGLFDLFPFTEEATILDLSDFDAPAGTPLADGDISIFVFRVCFIIKFYSVFIVENMRCSAEINTVFDNIDLFFAIVPFKDHLYLLPSLYSIYESDTKCNTKNR